MDDCAAYRCNRFSLLLLPCLVLLTSACTPQSMPIYHPSFLQAVDSKSITVEIARLEEIIAGNGENSRRPDPYLNLAVLLAHYDNPSPDYSRSLKMLETYTYLSSNSYSKRREEARYLKALLQQLAKGQRVHVQNLLEQDRLQKNIVDLQLQNERLLAQNRELEDAIEKLKALELQLEEQRIQLK